INLAEDSVPQVGTPQNIVVDEDGLAGANVDSAPLQGDPAETDSTENATGSGQVVVSFGGDVPPAPLVNSIVLLDSPALDGQLVDLDGNPVTFALNGSGQLIGTANSVTVMIISVTGAVAGPGAGQVTYTYQAQLLHPVQHADVGNNENSDFLNGVQFQVTDSDGDTSAPSSFNITVVDDVPSLGTSSGTEPTITVDETNLAVNNTGNFAPFLGAAGAVYGADGPGTTVFTLTVSSAGRARGPC